MRASAASILALAFATITSALPATVFAAPASSYMIVAEFPHSTGSYTEGFFYRDGLFYEGTGLKGSSAILVIEPETGKVVQ
jgi:glutaminyl-peptide cyclotransferase